ncbi:hypothetical protein Taro_034737 [Colocasia esculenta]|uniref:Uncharacterized protein n=1 Tax=Colocasia esculenta TaxID=4460 RepID=A0A843W1Q2_COLES|nr:hypothetical protein [Colocasia esculenta]
MVEYVAWDGYNRTVSQRTCSAPFGNTFRAGVLFLFGTIKADDPAQKQAEGSTRRSWFVGAKKVFEGL